MTTLNRSLKLVSFALTLCLAMAAHAATKPENIPLQFTPDVEGPLFKRLSASHTGVDFVEPIDTTHPLKRLYVSAFACGGVAVGDLNGDGRADLYFVSGSGRNRLFLQTDELRFSDATEAARVDGGEAWGGGAAMVDIEGDGDLDIYVCNYDSPNLLYINDGKARFVERARDFGLDIVDASLMPAFADYDLDGDLDLYLLTHRYHREGGRPDSGVTVNLHGKLFVHPDYEKYYKVTLVDGDRWEVNDAGRRDRFFRNDGDAGFVDVTDEAGLSEARTDGNSVCWFDYNLDGLPDIYVANDFQEPDFLYRNNGNGTFSDATRQLLPHVTWFSMGTAHGDIDNDGLPDLVSLDMAGTTHYKSKTTMGTMGANNYFMRHADPPQYMRNCLYLNTDAGRFLEVARMAGVAQSDWSWAARLGDFDNDGWLDLYVTNGVTRSFNNSDNPLDLSALVGQTEWDFFEDTPSRPEQNFAFRNKGAVKFADASKDWGLDHVGISYGAAQGDLDGDGDLDLVVMNLNEPVSIYRNDSGGSRVAFALEGEDGNRYGIGARLEIETEAGKQVRQLHPFSGFQSSNGQQVHFGLGEANVVERLTVHWPGGKTQMYENLLGNRRYTLRHSAEAPEVPPAPSKPKPLFRSSNALRGFAQWETPFPDFKHQPLLPNAQSQYGPCMAWADVDGDGDQDFFTGGPRDQLGTLHLNDGAGKFEAKAFEAAERESVCEDMGALFLDVEGDGDADLYVVSGGVEAPPGHAALADRLYLNDGRGNFSRAPLDRLPLLPASGCAVAAADFDRDGDLDIFTGGRVVPGSYPISEPNYLLVNNDGRLAPAPSQTAPGLTDTGIVTSAIWSDVDGDGWQDLLVAHEWGPVKLFKNDEGKLVERTEEAGLAPHTGWWNGISAGDIDGDGDIDYAVTNCGLNTKYKASAEKPELLFYGDVAGTGQRRIIEAKFENERCIPRRGFSCSSNAMPTLKTKLGTYHNFASSGLAEVYEEARLEEALKFEANTLESCLFINDGEGRFTIQPLPREAQVSLSFGSQFLDADGDGNLDLYLAHNFFDPQVETRPFDFGLSLLLKGDGMGGFEPVSPGRSGLIVPEDARSLVVTDFNADGRPDVILGVNDGPFRTFTNRSLSADWLTVRLAAGNGNPEAVGSRVTVRFSDGRSRTAEIHSGSGYLSQAPRELYFGLGDAEAEELSVVWPNGGRTVRKLTGEKNVVVRRPDSVSLAR